MGINVKMEKKTCCRSLGQSVSTVTVYKQRGPMSGQSSSLYAGQNMICWGIFEKKLKRLDLQQHYSNLIVWDSAFPVRKLKESFPYEDLFFTVLLYHHWGKAPEEMKL